MSGDLIGNVAESTPSLTRKGGPLAFGKGAAKRDLPASLSKDRDGNQRISSIVAFSEISDGGAGPGKVTEQSSSDTFARAVHQITGIDAALEGSGFDGAHFLGTDMTHAMTLRKKRCQVEWHRLGIEAAGRRFHGLLRAAAATL